MGCSGSKAVQEKENKKDDKKQESCATNRGKEDVHNDKPNEEHNDKPNEEHNDKPNEEQKEEEHKEQTKAKPKVVFVLGGPGSGKGTQCANLVEHFKFVHLSTGDLLRREVAERGPQADQIEEILNEGKLVPSEILVKLIKNEFEKNGKTGKYLLDGFPRSQENVDEWEKQVGDSAEVPFLLYLVCSEEVLEQRLLKRGETSGRSDDNIEAIKKRFATFRDETEPILELYRRKSLTVEVDSEKEIDEVKSELIDIFTKWGLEK